MKKIISSFFLFFIWLNSFSQILLKPANILGAGIGGKLIPNGNELLIAAQGLHILNPSDSYWKASFGITGSLIAKTDSAIFISNGYSLYKSIDNGTT